MKKKYLIVLALLFLTACGNPTNREKVKAEVVEDPSGVEFMSNQLIVAFNKDTEKGDIDKILKELEATTEESAMNDIDMYTITLEYKSFKTIEELNKYCDKITEKYKNIEACSSNNVYKLD